MPSSNVPSVGSVGNGDWQRAKGHYRLVVMGSARVGKTAIIQQFLYDQFPVDYSATVEELYRGEYEVGGCALTLDILDTSGSFEFPAMRQLAISTGDAFVLVYSVDNSESFEEIRRLRELIVETKGTSIPIVVVGNKIDRDDHRVVKKEVAETIIGIDWENGFVEASAKDNWNVLAIFKELLIQAHIPYDLSPAVQRRRRSLPNCPTKPGVTKDKVKLKRNSCAVS